MDRASHCGDSFASTSDPLSGGLADGAAAGSVTKVRGGPEQRPHLERQPGMPGELLLDLDCEVSEHLS